MNVKKSIFFLIRNINFGDPRTKKKSILENVCPSANSSIQTTGYLFTRFAPNIYFWVNINMQQQF